MIPSRAFLKFFLDEGVPESVANVLRDSGHEVILLRESGIARGSADSVVCATAEENDSILIAHDGDMKQLARDRGISPGRFRRLSLLRLQCRETQSAGRVKAAVSLIEHELQASAASSGQRRIYIVIGDGMIRTHR